MLTRPLARTMSSVAKAPPRSCVRRFRSSRRARPVSSCCRSSITLPYCWTQVLRHGRLGEYHFLTQHRRFSAATDDPPPDFRDSSAVLATVLT